jgi:hypothetical protein
MIPGCALVALLATLGGAHADPKRPVPDYDGRGNPDADAESWALWIPRILLSPLYVASEYVVRRPLGAFISYAERDRWSDSLSRVAPAEDRGNHVTPTGRFDLGVLPHVGLSYARVGLLDDANVLEVHGATWGRRWLDAWVADRYAIDDHDTVQLRFELQRTQDNLFVGLGPDATRATLSRYGLARVEGSAGFGRRLLHGSRLDAEVGVHRIGFVDGACCGDPSLDERIARLEVMAPPGYRDDYTAGYARLELTLDGRRPRPEPGSGFYVHAEGAPSVNLHGQRSWIQYGGVVGGALDLTGHRRTLRLELALDFVDAIAGDAIPFTEYPTLGGELMPGFVAGWLTGRSGAAAQLAYSWPVWLGVDAEARLAIGNAFGAHLDGFSPGALRLSGDVGVTTSTARDQGLELLVGVGSETFDQGAGVTSLRVLLGSRRGF